MCLSQTISITGITEKCDFHSMSKQCSKHSVPVPCKNIYLKDGTPKASENAFSFHSLEEKHFAQFASNLLVTEIPDHA